MASAEKDITVTRTPVSSVRLVEPVPPEHGDEPVLDVAAVARRVFGFDQEL